MTRASHKAVRPKRAASRFTSSGRGIFLMRALMDEVEFSVRPDGGAVVRMRKRKAQPQ